LGGEDAQVNERMLHRAEQAGGLGEGLLGGVGIALGLMGEA
jgi:hypothetical protein